ncbi:hypothetical protein TWF970_010802 [Orbilia oligospora]|uniref:Uncharacterized protein n=1 Tax=Orbilia oligospora TaxID=2813651 RepID=A0A7C8R6W3_ORBOL|nr:hypothetical protein TWF970_010802 [Orbilia oligospora]
MNEKDGRKHCCTGSEHFWNSNLGEEIVEGFPLSSSEENTVLDYAPGWQGNATRFPDPGRATNEFARRLRDKGYLSTVISADVDTLTEEAVVELFKEAGLTIVATTRAERAISILGRKMMDDGKIIEYYVFVP